MANVFAAARDVLFANEDRAASAEYFEDENPAVDVRVILGFAEPDAGLFRTDAAVDGNKLWASKADLPLEPPEGALFVVGDRTLKVRTARTDELDLWWVCDVDEISAGS